MKKVIFYIFLCLSIGLNAFFIWKEMEYRRILEMSAIFERAMSGSVDTTGWDSGFKIFKDNLKKDYPELASKKYYYINIWASFCIPCIKEMPWMDSLAGNIDKDVAYFFVSSMGDSTARKIVDKRGFHIRNFRFINDMEKFISGAGNSSHKKTLTFPTVIICDNQGRIYHNSVGAYESITEAHGFVEEIKKLE